MTNFDDLMNMGMDAIEDLPPTGIPPTGHYNLNATATRETKEGGNDFIKFVYTVTAINEVKNPDELSQVAVGMEFVDFFSPLKKDGTVNEWGMKFLKATVLPYAQHFGTTSFDGAIAAINNVAIAATLVRTVDKQDTDKFKMRLNDVVIL
jgi:hypothetical protein